jgi:hypothetical protein
MKWQYTNAFVSAPTLHNHAQHPPIKFLCRGLEVPAPQCHESIVRPVSVTSGCEWLPSDVPGVMECLRITDNGRQYQQRKASLFVDAREHRLLPDTTHGFAIHLHAAPSKTKTMSMNTAHPIQHNNTLGYCNETKTINQKIHSKSQYALI